MSSQPPYENNPSYIPPTQYSQSGGYTSDPYAPPTYPPENPYAQPPENPYTQAANPYMAQPQPQYVFVQGAPEPGSGLAIAGLILGIVSVVLFWFPYLGIPVSIAGIITSALGRRSVSRKGMAVAGLILSIAGIVLAACAIAFVLIFAWRYAQYSQ